MTITRDNATSHLADCKPGTVFRYRGEQELYVLVSMDYDSWHYTALKLDLNPDGIPDRVSPQLPEDGTARDPECSDVYLFRIAPG